MIIYLHTKCSTCQKALQFLEKNKIAVTVKDITIEPPSLKELQTMLNFNEGNIKKLLNTSGLLYREMQLSAKLKDMPLPEILTLLSKHGMLIKRPFLISKEFGITGFNESVWIKTVNSFAAN